MNRPSATASWSASWRLLAVLCALGVVAVTAQSMPPAAVTLPQGQGIEEPVRGVIHVHSRRSDGTGTVAQIAEAAARAGLQFVIITDHGDAAREPEPPSYRSGVLCIDAVEITTTGGHLVALGLWQEAPYPLGGEPRDVVEDVARLGGMSIAAHPGSTKPSLRWMDWRTPVDGLELLNADSEWRDEGIGSLVRTLFTYPWRKPETLAALLDRPVEPLRVWDGLIDQRPVIALAAADAHANIGVETDALSVSNRFQLEVPAYEQVFRSFSVALPALRLTGDAAVDARAVVREIRDGHLYSAVDAFASPARLAFTASSGSRTAISGDELPADGPVTIEVTSNAPAAARVALLSRGREVASATGPALRYVVPAERAPYRVEVQLPGASSRPEVPWLIANPIYVGGFPEASGEASERSAEPRETRVFDPPSTTDWSIEKNDESRAAFELVQGEGGRTKLLLRYTLEGVATNQPWVAFLMRAGQDLQRFDRLMFSARAEKPMRLWVQLRTPRPSNRLYWRRSVYLDQTERQISMRFDDMRSIENPDETPTLAHAESVLFVVDRTHTPLGGSGRVWLGDLRYGR